MDTLVGNNQLFSGILVSNVDRSKEPYIATARFELDGSGSSRLFLYEGDNRGENVVDFDLCNTQVNVYTIMHPVLKWK